ncbi:kinase-like protein [Aspergillus sclerotioniger CBS 115572]|uniref:Kinase-like protein n=1 Tax=Aspergillus sclerotioniger CBS 115572 TaxID=1450535 RepID=A0A317V4X5_9EURO|nr:kinase-like protein [Aspergillus sclerotioniger CBS 115572]PWY69036.1 kinase-like protein [Aspergillus sclerotioniger CBS 115572]
MAQRLASLIKHEINITVLLLWSNFSACVGPILTGLYERYTASSAKLDSPNLLLLVVRVMVVSFVYAYVFDIAHQTTSVAEDIINKPYRPIPAGMLTMSGAYRSRRNCTSTADAERGGCSGYSRRGYKLDTGHDRVLVDVSDYPYPGIPSVDGDRHMNRRTVASTLTAREIAWLRQANSLFLWMSSIMFLAWGLLGAFATGYRFTTLVSVEESKRTYKTYDLSTGLILVLYLSYLDPLIETHIPSMLSKQQSPPSSPMNTSTPINDTPFNRYSTLLAIKLFKRTRQYYGGVLMLTDKLCVKYGRHVHLSEASTMRFIAEHTSIPVPKVYCAFTRSGRTYIIMERINGDMIGMGWVKRPEKTKAKMLSQLSGMISEMRELKPPEGMGVASVDNGSLYDCRLLSHSESIRFGPFDTVQDFHRYLRMGVEADTRHDPEIQALIEQHGKDWPLVFTHGDLSSLNILARDDEVVGIVDWETAGWYPSYWEYTTASQVNPQNSFWIHEIDKFLQPMPEELAMEGIRQKYFGDL